VPDRQVSGRREILLFEEAGTNTAMDPGHHRRDASEQLEDPRYANAWPMGFVIEIVFTLCQRGASWSRRASW
jgi:hypothetical protein